MVHKNSNGNSQAHQMHAEMMYMASNSADMKHMSDMSNMHHNMMNHAMSQDSHSNMALNTDMPPCCDDGIHYCESNCSDSSCMVISSAPVLQPYSSLIPLSIEQAVLFTASLTQLTSRTIAPEQRPPLYNS